ncbi:MAG: PaREP1 family protein [bacterium]
MNKRLALAEGFLKEGKLELKRYKATGNEMLLREACEKGWGCVMAALKAVNPEIKYHKDFGKTATQLAKKYNNEEIVHGESCGEALHRTGFYEGDMDVETVEVNFHCLEKFLKIIDNILSNHPPSPQLGED